MSTQHLTDEELDRLLAGERPDAEREEHLLSCLMCRRRRDAFLHAVSVARFADADEAARERVREAALTAWSGRRREWRRWWIAAAAVLLLALLLPLTHRLGTRQVAVNPDAVLQEVDAVLARDPLAAMASEDVVETVVPTPAPQVERSAT